MIPNRRQFIVMAAAGVAASAAVEASAAPAIAAVKIQRIDLFPVRYPMKGYFKFFVGPRGGQGRAAVIVKITADDGTVGWGQSVPIAKWSYETWETSFIALRDYFVPALIGRDPTDIEGALAVMDDAVAPGFSTGMPITRAGIDLALHDLTGRLRGQSVSQLWGKPLKPGASLPLSWTVNVKAIDDVAAVVAQGREAGYKHFNIKVAPDPDFDVTLAKAVRRLAPDAFLWADANGGYDRKTALAAAPKLADAGVDVLEAPLRPNQLSGYQALKRQNALPILMDEGVIHPTDLDEFDRLGMMHGVAMKPSRCGGLWSCRKQIELCAQRELTWLGSGLTDPDISLAASLCLYGAFGLSKPAALNGPQFLTADVLAKSLTVERGSAAIPAGPGLGIEVDESKVVELMKRSGGDKLLAAAG